MSVCPAVGGACRTFHSRASQVCLDSMLALSSLLHSASQRELCSHLCYFDFYRFIPYFPQLTSQKVGTLQHIIIRCDIYCSLFRCQYVLSSLCGFYLLILKKKKEGNGIIISILWLTILPPYFSLPYFPILLKYFPMNSGIITLESIQVLIEVKLWTQTQFLIPPNCHPMQRLFLCWQLFYLLFVHSSLGVSAQAGVLRLFRFP